MMQTPAASSAAFLVPLALLFACAPEPDARQDNSVAPPAAAVADPAEPPSPQRPPEPIVDGKPLRGDWDPDTMTVELAGRRLVVQDAGRRYSLQLGESTYDDARETLAKFGTPARSLSIAECPAGQLAYLDYANGLQLAFQGGKLEGYWVKEGARGIATSGGIRPGSPRTALGDTPIRDESFGKLAMLGDTVALLDDGGNRVTDLYSGLACIFD